MENIQNANSMFITIMAILFKIIFGLFARVVGFSVWFLLTCWTYMFYVVIASIMTAYLNR